MAMPAPETQWTAEMVRALPDDGNRYELLDGELVVSPAPSLAHQSVVGELLGRFREYLRGKRIGAVFASPADMEFSTGRLVQPDVFVAPLIEGKRPREWSAIKQLLLVVEVASPSTVRVDRGRKRKIYLEEEVPEYWIVHPDARLAECWRPGLEQPVIVDDVLRWRPAPDGPELIVDLPELFEEALG